MIKEEYIQLNIILNEKDIKELRSGKSLNIYNNKQPIENINIIYDNKE